MYQRYLLSKLSWHLTVANLAKTWVIENLDSITIRFIRQWLDLPISATLSGIILPCNQFGLNLQLPSVKFIQCQTVLRNALRSSKSDNIKSLWKSTSCSMNVQYDSYNNTKQVLKAVRQQHTEKLQSQLTSQGFIISFLLEHSMKSLNSLWSSAQSKLPKNIFNFSIRYLSNTLANLDSITIRFIRQWLDLPISATLSGIILPCNQFGLNLQLPSVKFIQCQTVLRNALRSSKSDNIKSLWKSTSCSMNVQYDSYKNAKQVLKAVRQQHTEKLQSQLTSQGFIISFLLEHSMKSLNSLWSSAQSKLPKNIFNFSIRYLSNTLANGVNLYKWKLSQSSDSSFCLRPESLLYVVSGCKSYLEEGRYTWRHNSALHFVASTLQSVRYSSLYADLPGFLSPCIITGDQLRPDMLLSIGKSTLYMIELTVGFETNLNSNAERKHEKYHRLTRDLSSDFHNIKFINLSLSALGIFGKSCEPFIDMCKELEFDKHHIDVIVRKLSTIIIRSTYYIFCMRNKPWTNPDLLIY